MMEAAEVFDWDDDDVIDAPSNIPFPSSTKTPNVEKNVLLEERKEEKAQSIIDEIEKKTQEEDDELKIIESLASLGQKKNPPVPKDDNDEDDDIIGESKKVAQSPQKGVKPKAKKSSSSVTAAKPPPRKKTKRISNADANDIGGYDGLALVEVDGEEDDDEIKTEGNTKKRKKSVLSVVDSKGSVRLMEAHEFYDQLDENGYFKDGFVVSDDDEEEDDGEDEFEDSENSHSDDKEEDEEEDEYILEDEDEDVDEMEIGENEVRLIKQNAREYLEDDMYADLSDDDNIHGNEIRYRPRLRDRSRLSQRNLYDKQAIFAQELAEIESKRKKNKIAKKENDDNDDSEVTNTYQEELEDGDEDYTEEDPIEEVEEFPKNGSVLIEDDDDDNI